MITIISEDRGDMICIDKQTLVIDEFNDYYFSVLYACTNYGEKNPRIKVKFDNKEFSKKELLEYKELHPILRKIILIGNDEK